MMTGLLRKFIDGAVFGAGFSIALVAIVFIFTKLKYSEPSSDPSGQLDSSELIKLQARVERVNFVSGRISVEGKIENTTAHEITSFYLNSMIRVAGVPIDKCSQSVKQRVNVGEVAQYVIVCGKSSEVADPSQLSADVTVEAAYSK